MADDQAGVDPGPEEVSDGDDKEEVATGAEEDREITGEECWDSWDRARRGGAVEEEADWWSSWEVQLHVG